MTPFKTTALILMLPALYACGGRVVEFRLDSDTGLDSDSDSDSPPFVIENTPLDAQTGVSVAVGPTATFSEAMDAATIGSDSFPLAEGATFIAGTVTLDGLGETATFTPDVALDFGRIYTATITTGALDLSGLAMLDDHVWSFSTTAATLPPEVIFTTPADAETGVSTGANPTATFNKDMDPATISALSFIVEQGSTPILGTVTLDAGTDTATFAPTLPLASGRTYTATITTAAEDSGGFALAADYVWTFSTASVGTPPTVIFTVPTDAEGDVALDVQPTATFSTGMDPATLDELTFLLDQGTTPILGTVTLDEGTDTAMFTPDVALQAGLIYTATVTTGAQDLAGTGLAADYTWSFSTADADLPPEVIFTVPADGDTGVSVDVEPTATFSTGMDPATLDELTFIVEQGSTLIPGTVTLDTGTDTAMFSPDVALEFGLVYTATVTTGAEDLGGLALAADYSWSFTTTGEPPEVIATSPEDAETGVSVDVEPTATFSTDMDPTTLNALTFLVEQGTNPISGVVTFDSGTDTATFSPDAPFESGLIYTATITTGAEDLGGLALVADYTWSFSPSTIPPEVTATTPLEGASDVSINVQPTATFSVAMDPLTINALSFLVEAGSTPVLGTVSLDETTNTATFIPDTALDVGVLYTATITTGAEDLAGTPLASDYIWSFSTDACSMATVELGSSSDFVTLAGSTVTSTGLTIITGDVGVSPGTAVTGFPPGLIIGTTHAGDPTAATAIADLTTAYNDAAGRSLCSVSVAGNLGGQTLTPGLYTSTSSLEISSGDLTLDAQGDSSAVFIFQTASTLTTTSGRQVILTNGANAANVYWQVGSSATLGTASVFQGTIMADQAITLETGASLNGRALARIAAVSLDSNIIVTPAP